MTSLKQFKRKSLGIFFANNIVFVDDTKSRVNAKLEILQGTLESKNFQLSRTKTKYMECTLNKVETKAAHPRPPTNFFFQHSLIQSEIVQNRT